MGHRVKIWLHFNFPFPARWRGLQLAMPSDFDSSEFVDTEVHTTVRPHVRPAIMSDSTASNRPPSREELDHKVSDAQQQLAELKRKQEELERERATLEESRRRRVELETGHEEMLHQLTRSLGPVGPRLQGWVLCTALPGDAL